MAETILGIDLGTTNSEVAIIRDGKPVVIPDENGDPILPSVVGLDPAGKLLVGRAARNQYALAPERTIRSIKRLMGQEKKVRLGEQEYTPQEISAMILRVLKERVERAEGRPITKAVVTVPAFFTEGQRDATREAGSLAGLEVVRIINEPTAAALAYEPHPTARERLLVYDLGGGTFDVSIVQIEQGVVEVLASHGDAHLGGDDFDQQLLEYVCYQFSTAHGVDLQANAVSRSRVLSAVEQAKKELSFHPVVELAEEFLAEKENVSLHLKRELERVEYEKLIAPLLDRTLTCLDKALEDANLTAQDVDKILLVGGATRTPAVHRLLEDRLGKTPRTDVEPDLCVALGAAVQAGLIAGIDVGPVLVDITPHTLGIETLGELQGFTSENAFSPIIRRNTPLPAARTEEFFTASDGQKEVLIRVFQGENRDTRHNEKAGEFMVEGLQEVEAGNKILVRFDLDLNGILKVTATERRTGLAKALTIDNVMSRFRNSDRAAAVDRLDSVWGDSENPAAALEHAGVEIVAPAAAASGGLVNAAKLVGRAAKLIPAVNSEDAEQLRERVAEIGDAMAEGNQAKVEKLLPALEDLVFYLEDV